MPDLELQLREYLDATVERITPEDVFARHALGRRVAHQPHRLAPAWAAAYGFAMTLLVIGGSIGIGLVLRTEPGFSTGPGRISYGAGTSTSELFGWLLVGLAAVLGIAALVLIGFALSTNHRKRRKEEAMATTLDRPPIERELESVHRTNRWLIAAVVVLAIAVVALGAWVVYDLTTDSSAVPAEVEALVEDYMNALSTYDGDALMATMYEPTFRFKYGTALSLNAADNVASLAEWEADGMKVEISGDLAFTEAAYPYDYYVAVPLHMTSTANPGGSEGIELMGIIDRVDTGLRVTYAEYFGSAP